MKLQKSKSKPRQRGAFLFEKFGYNNSMNQNKSFFILTFVLAALLAVVFYSSTQDKQDTAGFLPSGAHRTRTTAKPVTNPALEQLKTQEFLGLEDATGTETDSSRPSAPQANNTGLPVVSSPLERKTSPSISISPSLARSGQSATLQTPYYSTQREPSLYNQAAQNLQEGRAVTPSGSYGSTSGATAPQRAYQMGGNFAPSSSGEQEQNKTSKALFSPYMAALTKDEAAKLEKTLDGLTDRVEEAVLRALLPKSKKDTNIEKYLSRNSSGGQSATSTQSGPFAQVAKQISYQKNSIMKSMQNAFGAGAAKQAGQIMDAYQQELMNVLNQEGLSTQERQQKTRQISKKYNDKLKDLSANEGQKRMQDQLNKRDGDLLAHYKKSYDEKTAAALGAIMDKYRAQELALAQQELTQDEYFEKALALQRKRDAEMRKYLTDNKKSLSPYVNAPRQEEQQNADELQLPYHASEQEQKLRQQDIVERSNALLKEAHRLYGDEGSAVFQDIYQRYADEMAEIWANPETTKQEKEALSEKALRKNNDDTTRAQLKLDEERYIQAVRQSMADAAPEMIADTEQHVRNVLDQMNARIDAILSNPNLTDEQRQQQMQEARQVAQRQLTGK